MKRAQKLIEYPAHSNEIFKGELLHVFADKARLPDQRLGTREWIKHPGACAIVPVFGNGDIMLIQQYRYPVHQLFYEVPAGKIDPNELQDATARRELREETGLSCESLNYVGHFYPAIGYSDEIIHIYVAEHLKEHELQTDADEFVNTVRVPFDEALQMIHSGEINDGKTVICLLRASEYLSEKHST